jgi:hypothetical protein
MSLAWATHPAHLAGQMSWMEMTGTRQPKFLQVSFLSRKYFELVFQSSTKHFYMLSY